MRVCGDILPVIKKRLVKRSRGSLFLPSREAGVYVLIFLYYNIVPAAHLLEIKLPRSSVGREALLIPATLDQVYRREQNLHARNTLIHHILSNSRVMTRLTYKWKSGL